jgi:uncharacterized membrane protein
MRTRPQHSTRSKSDRSPALAAALLSALLTTTGTLHFLRPAGFAEIVPRALGAPRLWVALSGAAELGCAAAIAFAPTRRVGAWAAAALFVAVFPANLQMALDSGQGAGLTHNPAVAWGRLPLQIPLIGWAVYVGAAKAKLPLRP